MATDATGPAAALTWTPAEVDCGAVPLRTTATRTLRVHNGSRKRQTALIFDCAPGRGTGTWIVAVPARLSLDPGAEATVTLHVHAGRSTFGARLAGRVLCRSDDGEQTLPVTLTLAPPRWRRPRSLFAAGGALLGLVGLALLAHALTGLGGGLPGAPAAEQRAAAGGAAGGPSEPSTAAGAGAPAAAPPDRGALAAPAEPPAPRGAAPEELVAEDDQPEPAASAPVASAASAPVTPAAHVPRRGPERGAQRAEPAPRPAAAESGPFRPAARKSVSGAAVRKANKLNAQGFAKYRAGRPADALRFYLAAVRTNPNDPYYWYNAACIYSIRGEVSSALRHLEGFAQRLTPTQLARARVKIDIDSDLDRIRRDSRFLEFRRRLRL
jgi:hypothetical protein